MSVLQASSRLLATALLCLSGLAHAQEVTVTSPGHGDERKVHPKVSSAEDGRVRARALELTRKAWTGDFDQMLERRVIRVLVPYSRTLYFQDRGRQRGITAEFVRDFERYLNEKYRERLRNRPLTVAMIPGTRNVMFDEVANGLGDIAAGNLTVTEERLKVVDFVAPTELPPVSELLLTGPKSPAMHSLDDLAGKTVHVRKTSSSHESLVALNERFSAEGKEPMTLALVPDGLEDEDMMEMLNVGLFEAIVVKDWMAKMWVQILPKVHIHKTIVLRSGGRIGWAIRKDSPQLDYEIRDFFKNYVLKEHVVESDSRPT
jgi:membrane-bound lytic murein transglycosylase MltF